MLSNYRFKRSYFDPKNGDIELYYSRNDGSTLLLQTNTSCRDNTWPNLPKDLQKHARLQCKTLKKV